MLPNDKPTKWRAPFSLAAEAIRRPIIGNSNVSTMFVDCP